MDHKNAEQNIKTTNTDLASSTGSSTTNSPFHSLCKGMCSEPNKSFSQELRFSMAATHFDLLSENIKDSLCG